MQKFTIQGKEVIAYLQGKSNLIVSGNTYPIKEKIKALGGIYNPEKKVWQINSKDEKICETLKENNTKIEIAQHKHKFTMVGSPWVTSLGDMCRLKCVCGENYTEAYD